ncbi:MAG: transcription antitermination factor NusB [SAR116 cluster bacterium]|nr:transcription antitermination factor NusB [SAR116 cluster bacterium]
MTDASAAKNAKVASETSKTAKLRPMAVRRRAAARLASVQLGYSTDLTSQSLLEAVPAFLDVYAGDIARQLRVKKMDEDHFQALVSGVDSRKAELDRIIAEALSDGWTMSRLARPELAILRAGVFELDSMPHIPARAVLSEYASLADAFQADVAFVNAVLDRLARQFRVVEMSADVSKG